MVSLGLTSECPELSPVTCYSWHWRKYHLLRERRQWRPDDQISSYDHYTQRTHLWGPGWERKSVNERATDFLLSVQYSTLHGAVVICNKKSLCDETGPTLLFSHWSCWCLVSVTEGCVDSSMWCRNLFQEIQIKYVHTSRMVIITLKTSAHIALTNAVQILFAYDH